MKDNIYFCFYSLEIEESPLNKMLTKKQIRKNVMALPDTDTQDVWCLWHWFIHNVSGPFQFHFIGRKGQIGHTFLQPHPEVGT